ncbi:integrator complex subunit 5 [Chrysoperla carnea]|uniref:integrator complex subunit 5 n=1 Tax=Chrysoperla carnea TaxID=189513 RepID=UPI001D08E30A|nr:integrator complex subunit 5 [Chrysoperla carnea]
MNIKDDNVNIRTFVEGLTKITSDNLLELTKISLTLLKSTPAIKDAALEFYCTLFNMAVRTYLQNIETEISTGRTVGPGESSAEEEEASVAEVHTALCNYITANPEVWAPIVSTWSLQLLGELSTRYAGRAHIPVDSGLNEKMHLWMGCRATRTLMDITTQCLSCLMDSDTETCISALLDSSVKHSPHFDWVVAHVGNCFPDTVITRVLSCGLKDFAQHSRVSISESSPHADKANRLTSIVGILDHLASSHFNDIRTALLDLFHSSLQYQGLEPEVKLQKRVTVPYLLQLASTSHTLRKALTMNIQETVNVNMITQFNDYISEWCKHFQSSESFLDLVVQLALGCEHGGIQIINLLLDCITSQQLPSSIQQNCHLILENILLELDLLIRSGTNNIDFLTSIGKDLHHLEQILLFEDDTTSAASLLRQDVACRIIILLGNKNPPAFMLISSYLIRKSKTDNQLKLLVKILSDNLSSLSFEFAHEGDCLGQAIEHAIGHTTMTIEEEDELFSYVDNNDIDHENADNNGDDIDMKDDMLSFTETKSVHNISTVVTEPYSVKAQTLWSNMLKLLKWEKAVQKKINESKVSEFNIIESFIGTDRSSKKSSTNGDKDNETGFDQENLPSLLTSHGISKAIFSNLMEVSLIFGDCTRHSHVSHILAELLVLLNVPSQQSILKPPSLELLLHLTTVTVKYFFQSCLEDDPHLRATYTYRTCVLLNRLCVSVGAARTLAIRELLEHALFKPQSVLFGAKFNPNKSYSDDLLLYQNLKQGTSTLLQRDSSIFHAGVIGSGCRKQSASNQLEKDAISANTTWLINAIEACCMPALFDEESSNEITDENIIFNTKITLETMEKVSLFLVENISSDVMYNGLPWPEEEHMKVTIERDLHIRRMFSDIPLLWELMFMLSKYPPSLCFCSVLLRALTATLLHQWNSLGNRGSGLQFNQDQSNLDSLTAQTIQLLDLMAIGQLLPRPLSNIRDIITILTPTEIVQLLRECVWSYMRPNEHVPSPALFKVNSQGQYYRDPESIKPGAQYTDPLRLILQRNIDTLGEQFWLMFDTSTNEQEEQLNKKTEPTQQISTNYG